MHLHGFTLAVRIGFGGSPERRKNLSFEWQCFRFGHSVVAAPPTGAQGKFAARIYDFSDFFFYVKQNLELKCLQCHLSSSSSERRGRQTFLLLNAVIKFSFEFCRGTADIKFSSHRRTIICFFFFARLLLLLRANRICIFHYTTCTWINATAFDIHTANDKMINIWTDISRCLRPHVVAVFSAFKVVSNIKNQCTRNRAQISTFRTTCFDWIFHLAPSHAASQLISWYHDFNAMNARRRYNKKGKTAINFTE